MKTAGNVDTCVSIPTARFLGRSVTNEILNRRQKVLERVPVNSRGHGSPICLLLGRYKIKTYIKKRLQNMGYSYFASY